jgi:hypothetical protein
MIEMKACRVISHQSACSAGGMAGARQFVESIDGRRSTTTAPGGIGRMSCRTATSARTSLLPLPAIRTATRLAVLLLPKPSSARHRNSTLTTIRCARATCETVVLGCSVSSTMAGFSAAVLLACGWLGVAADAVLKMYLNNPPLALSVAPVLGNGRTLG